jgi:anaerobic selenocysteine-containing dehydrogenase
LIYFKPSGKIKAVWIMATNPVVSLPDAEQVKRALEKCEFVVFQIFVLIPIPQLMQMFCFLH